MRLPSPSYRGYSEFVATVVVTTSVLQYFGVAGAVGDVNHKFLLGAVLILLVFMYVLNFLCVSTTRVSQWGRMVRGEGSDGPMHDDTLQKV